MHLKCKLLYKVGAGREDRTLIKRLETSYNSHYTIPAI